MTKAKRSHIATAKVLAELNREFWPHVVPAPPVPPSSVLISTLE